MKSGKFLFLAIIFLVSLVCISAVSAADEAVSDVIADTNDETVLQESIDDADLGDSENDELGESDEIALDDADETTLKDDSSPGTFADLDEAINGNDNTEITLDSNYLYEGGDKFLNGINITRDLTIDGNGHTIDGNHGARIFHVMDNKAVTFININFINGYTKKQGYGGAIWSDIGCIAINCTFSNNHAYYGGAISRCNALNCIFDGNSAEEGGAIYAGDALNCTFRNNNAYDGEALCGDWYTEDGNGEYRCKASLCIFENNDYEYTDIISAYLISADLTTTYNSSDKLLFNLSFNNQNYDKLNTKITISKDDEVVGTYYGLTGENGGWVVDLPAGTYKAVLSLVDLEGVEPAEITITVEPADSSVSAAAVTTTYNENKDLVVTLNDGQGNPLSGEEITVDLNGAKTYTTDENGEVKIAVGSLVPDTYTVKISFAGNDNYLGSDATTEVTVKKATPKITASAKTFTFEDKTKKYTVTLKDNNGKALKNTKVTVKCNGKSYTATTNSKGVATFKLSDITKGKKLTKKATYNAVISFAGDKYYNKVTKNVKLSVKAYAWKTVAKGSKDKAMVKKIQRALKKNHFYISFKGRYLKIDGIYHKYTVMAVKEFQRAKKLKVTGKVDEATAKKLKVY